MRGLGHHCAYNRQMANAQPARNISCPEERRKLQHFGQLLADLPLSIYRLLAGNRCWTGVATSGPNCDSEVAAS